MGLMHVFGFGHGAIILDYLMETECPYTQDEIEEWCIPFLRADDEIEKCLKELEYAGLVELSDKGWMIKNCEEVDMMKRISFNATKGQIDDCENKR